MSCAVVTLKKGEGRMLKSGGAWIFDNEIDSVLGEFDDGDIVLVHDFDGYPMGSSMYPPSSSDTPMHLSGAYRKTPHQSPDQYSSSASAHESLNAG